MMRLLLYVSIVLTLTHKVRAQQYELVEPSGLVSAAVEVGRGRLIVYERSGERDKQRSIDITPPTQIPDLRISPRPV